MTNCCRFNRAWMLAAIALLFASACVVVPAYRRGYLADPSMSPNEDPLESRAQRKFHTVREGASGGDGEAAGGGCGCAN